MNEVTSHTLFRWVDATQVALHVSHTRTANGDFKDAKVKVMIHHAPHASPTVEFDLARMPADVVEERATARGVTSADLLLAEVEPADGRDLLLGASTPAERQLESGNEFAKVTATIRASDATLHLKVGAWIDTVAVAIDNFGTTGSESNGQFWSIRPVGTGWEAMLT